MSFSQVASIQRRGGNIMRHPYEKFIRIELAAIALAILIGIIVLIKGYLILLFACFYLLVISLLSEAMIAWFTQNKVQSGKQIIRALIIFSLTTYLIFQ